MTGASRTSLRRGVGPATARTADSSAELSLEQDRDRTVPPSRHRPTAVGRSRRQAARRWAVAVAVVTVLGVSAAACSSEGTSATSTQAGDAATGAQPVGEVMSGASAAPAVQSTDPVESPAVDQGDDTTASMDPPLPNPISGSPTKVSRPGQPEQPTVTADSVAFSAPTTYGDNTVLTITKATAEVETGNGPGVFNGREFVKFDLELTNGSGQPIDLNSVVVTAYYGTTNQLAAPVYTPSAGTEDFSGVVEPGATATASYGFAVPTSELGNVTMVVDFDAVHSSATFTGAVNL